MFNKSKDILNSKTLLRIDPPKPAASKYLRIFLLIVFTLFTGFFFFAFASLPTNLLFLEGVSYILLCAIFVAGFMILKPTSLVFTDKGITASFYFSVYWDELEFYNFMAFKDIGMKEEKQILQISSNKPPFYHARFLYLPRFMIGRGLFFTGADKAKAEEIFRNKGISIEP
jgi:hypothetical protein